MPASIQHKLRVLLVLAYIPLVASLGMLHTDDGCATGTGHLTVGFQHVTGGEVPSPTGMCLACQFTAGHIFEQGPHIPVLATRQLEAFFEVSDLPRAFNGTQTARAPPDSSLS